MGSGKTRFKINLLLVPDPLRENASSYIKLFYHYLNQYTDYINLIHFETKIGRNIEMLRLIKLFFSLFKAHIVHVNWPDIRLGITKARPRLRSVLFRFMYWFVFLSIAKVKRSKIIITHHDILPHKCLPYKCSLKNFELKLLDILLRKSDLIIVLNNFSKKFLCSIHSYGICKKTIVIPHFHYDNYYGIPVDKETAKRRVSISPDKFVVLILGTISEYKAPDFIIQTIERTCRRSHGNIVFLIVGKQNNNFVKAINNIRTNLEQFNNCIQIVNKFIPENELNLYLSAADLALLTYKWIWGTATLNLYISYKIPVLFTPLPPLKEELGEVLHKYLSISNPYMASQKILLLSVNRDLYLKIKEISDEQISRILREKDPKYVILKHILIYYDLHAKNNMATT